MSILSEPHFHCEEAAYERLEAIVWPNGPVCPHCGGVDRITVVGGKTARPGLKRCLQCKRQFRATVGTVFESSHVKLHLWFQAAHLLASSKKGISAHQLHRTLKVTYKTAWFMAHRLREAMREGHFGPLGGEGKTVEIDETYIGGKDKNKHANKRRGRGGMDKEIAFSLVERGGKVRSHHVPSVNAKTLRPILREQIDAATKVYSDDGGARLGTEFAEHGTVNHSIGEYVRGDIHTNTIEGYFSILKRGINGVYHHVSQQHLKRYLAEFDFRYNERSALGVEDSERTTKAISGIVGKRLMYRDSSLA
jgi:transposase-like protein